MLGQAEKSELDPELDGLLTKADKTKQWTEKMLRQTESVLQPNPSESGLGKMESWWGKID